MRDIYFISNLSPLKKFTRDLRNIHTTVKSYRDTLPCANMTLKVPRYFYLLMEKLLGCHFQVQYPYYQAAKTTKKHIFSYPQGDRSDLRKPIKDKNQH